MSVRAGTRNMGRSRVRDYKPSESSVSQSDQIQKSPRRKTLHMIYTLIITVRSDITVVTGD